MNAWCYRGCCAAAMIVLGGTSSPTEQREGSARRLPPAVLKGDMSLEEAIAKRRSAREFGSGPLTEAQVAQLCWAGQGITDTARMLRTVPSAGALYPIELYVVTAEGVDHYDPKRHVLSRHVVGEVRAGLQRAALDQEAAGKAALCIVIAAEVQRSAHKYGSRAERYCFIEAGHVAQNLLLQATALKLTAVPIGAFADDELAGLLKLPKAQRALYIVAVGTRP